MNRTSQRRIASWGVPLGLSVTAGFGAVFLPAPYVWLGVALVLGSVVVAMLGRNGVVRRVCLVIGAVVLALTAVEGMLYVAQWRAPAERFEGSYSSPKYWNRNDPLLGYGPHRNVTVEARKYRGDSLVYDVTYTIDADGLRRSSPPTADTDRSAQACVLFFGGSITFGEGVEDDQSLPYIVGSLTGSRFRVFNFGFHGYGPHQMLAALESGWAARIADCSGSVFAVLQYDVGHVNRLRGAPWDPDGPRYLPGDDGVLVAAGRFNEPPPDGVSVADSAQGLPTPLTVEWLVSSLGLRYYDDTDRRWFNASILTAKRELERLYPGVEVHLVLRDPFRDPAVVEALEARGVHVHPIRTIIPDFRLTSPEYTLAGDPHPNAVQYRRIAEYLVERVLRIPE